MVAARAPAGNDDDDSDYDLTMDHDIPAQTAAGESGAMEPAAAEGPSVKCRLYEWPLGHEGTNDIDDIGASTHRPAIEEPKIRTGAELTRARKHLSSAHHSILIIISALFSITFSVSLRSNSFGLEGRQIKSNQTRSDRTTDTSVITSH